MGQKWGTFCGGRFIIGSNDVKMFKTSSDHGKLLSICKIAKKKHKDYNERVLYLQMAVRDH